MGKILTRTEPDRDFPLDSHESESEVAQTVAHQTPLSMGFSRQEYWSGLPFPSPGDLPNPGIKPVSPALQADALTSEPPGNRSNQAESSGGVPHPAHTPNLKGC